MNLSHDVACAYEMNELANPAHRLVMSTMYSAAALVTTVLNFLILISILKTPSLHKPSYILIGNLVLSDLLVGAIGEPLMVIYNIAALKRWSLKNFCLSLKSARGVVYALGSVSLFTLTAVSLDRLLAVKLRNRYQNVVTKKRVLYILLTWWIIVCVVSAIVYGKLSWNSETLSALILFVGTVVFILVLTITVCYSMAFYSLRKIISSSVSPSVQNAEGAVLPSSNIDVAKYRKSLLTMFVVFMFTIIVYLPFSCILMVASVSNYYESKLSSQAPRRTAGVTIFISISAAEYFSLLNSAMNSLVYLWRIRDIREAVKTTIKQLPWTL